MTGYAIGLTRLAHPVSMPLPGMELHGQGPTEKPEYKARVRQYSRRTSRSRTHFTGGTVQNLGSGRFYCPLPIQREFPIMHSEFAESSGKSIRTICGYLLPSVLSGSVYYIAEGTFIRNQPVTSKSIRTGITTLLLSGRMAAIGFALK